MFQCLPNPHSPLATEIHPEFRTNNNLFSYCSKNGVVHCTLVLIWRFCVSCSLGAKDNYGGKFSYTVISIDNKITVLGTLFTEGITNKLVLC